MLLPAIHDATCVRQVQLPTTSLTWGDRCSVPGRALASVSCLLHLWGSCRQWGTGPCQAAAPGLGVVAGQCQSWAGGPTSLLSSHLPHLWAGRCFVLGGLEFELGALPLQSHRCFLHLRLLGDNRVIISSACPGPCCFPVGTPSFLAVAVTLSLRKASIELS